MANNTPLKSSDLRTQVRDLLQNRDKDFNVLVVGRAGSCKSTLINSMHMALAEKWSELAAYGRGGAANTTLRLDKIPMFEDKFMTKPVENYKARVNFWDCAGIENTADEVYGEFIGLTLDGKVPDKESVFASVKSGQKTVTVKELRGKFPVATEGCKFNRLLFLCACDEVAPENLLDLVKRTTSPHKNKGRHIPVFLVLSKADRISENQRQYRETKQTAEGRLNLASNKQRVAELTLYHSTEEGEDGGCKVDDFGKFLPDEEIDRRLLILLINLLDPAFDRGIAYDESADSDPEVETETPEQPKWYQKLNKVFTQE